MLKEDFFEPPYSCITSSSLNKDEGPAKVHWVMIGNAIFLKESGCFLCCSWALSELVDVWEDVSEWLLLGWVSGLLR